MAETLPLSMFSLFNVVIEDIHLLHAVRYAESSYQTNLVRLAYVQLQLSRWGEAVGLNVGTEEDSKFGRLVPKEHQELAKQALKSMGQEFDIARKQTKPCQAKELYARKESASESDISTHEKVKPLTEGMRRWSWSRTAKSDSRRLSTLKKARWGIIDQDTFEKLLDRINGLMANLEGLFPSKQSEMKALVLDELLREAIEEVANETAGAQKSGGGNITSRFEGANYGVQAGRDVSWTGGMNVNQGK